MTPCSLHIPCRRARRGNFFYWLTQGRNFSTVIQHSTTPTFFDDQWIASFTRQLSSDSSDNAFQSNVSNAPSLSNHSGMGHNNADPTVQAPSSSERQCPCSACFKLTLSNVDHLGCLCTRCFADKFYEKYFESIETSSASYWFCHEKHCTFRSVEDRPQTWIQHYRSHLQNSGKYPCDSPNCSKSFKRWGDLLRHASSTHCINPKKFRCTFPGCERGGDNGFPRKDKLTSHYNNKHRGAVVLPSRPRNIAPKP